MSNRSTAHINISRASCIPISLLPTMHVQTGKSKWEIATDLSIITMMCLSYCLQFFLLTRARIRASVCMYRRERKKNPTPRVSVGHFCIYFWKRVVQVLPFSPLLPSSNPSRAIIDFANASCPSCEGSGWPGLQKKRNKEKKTGEKPGIHRVGMA